MNYSKEELAYILYNNRSISGVVSKFLPKNIDLQILLQIERKLNWCKKIYNQFERFIEIDKSKLDIDSEDVSLSKEDLSNLDSVVKSSISRFSDTEKIFLEKRGITKEITTKYQLCLGWNFSSLATLCYKNSPKCHKNNKNLVSTAFFHEKYCSAMTYVVFCFCRKQLLFGPARLDKKYFFISPG